MKRKTYNDHTNLLVRQLKILGGVECLQALLDWSDYSLVELDRDTVYKYLQSTKKELKNIK